MNHYFRLVNVIPHSVYCLVVSFLTMRVFLLTFGFKNGSRNYLFFMKIVESFVLVHFRDTMKINLDLIFRLGSQYGRYMNAMDEYE